MLFAASAAAASAATNKLIVIAIDGLDYRYLRDADRLHLKIPVLRRLMAGGEMAEGVVSVVPAENWPAMTSIMTGVMPAQHGVLSNDQADEKSRMQTLWQSAEKAHLKVAMIFWPASKSANATFLCPDVWDKPRGTTIPFEPIAAGCTTGLVSRITGTYPRFSKSIWNDETAMAALDYLLEHEQPDLTLARLSDLDAEERETGALSVYSREVLENDDEMLGRTLKMLPSHSVVAVVSDHGFETENFVVRPKVLLRTTAVEVKYGLIGTSDPTVAASMRKLVGAKKTGIAREVPLAELRRYWPSGKWIAAFDTMPGYIALNDTKGAAVGLGNHKGVHDLWPRRPGFRSVFIMWGDGIRPGKMGELAMPTVGLRLAAVLGLPLADVLPPVTTKRKN